MDPDGSGIKNKEVVDVLKATAVAIIVLSIVAPIFRVRMITPAFSQQSNALGVLFDVIPREEQQGVLRQVIAIDPGTTPGGILSSSYYFRFYLARALDDAGVAD
jgi:hypothetical protein